MTTRRFLTGLCLAADVFASAAAVAGTFAGDELTGRDAGFWATCRDRVRAVSVEDVQRVARRHLPPDEIVILAVDDVEAMLEGDSKRPEYVFITLARDGRIVRVPLPDPPALVYPAREPPP